MFILLVGLGTWQLERKTWKEGLIAALAERTGVAAFETARAVTWPETVRRLLA